MKFGHEYEKVLASTDFDDWRATAIDYKYLKKCIKNVHRELSDLGLDADTVVRLSKHLDEHQQKSSAPQHHEFFSAAEPGLEAIPEEFVPQIRVLVDRNNKPLDAHLAPETKESLRKLAQHERIAAPRQAHLGHHAMHELRDPPHHTGSHVRPSSLPSFPSDISADARWIQIPLASARDFFTFLAPKLDELEQLRNAETAKLEEEILDLGDKVLDVIEPVREGFEAKRDVSKRDLYFWREMFRIYLEKPVFYSSTEQNRGALTYADAYARLEAYEDEIKRIGLMKKMKTQQAVDAAKMFWKLNVRILNIMHFQELNARAMTKILKKFNKQTHLEGKFFLQDLMKKYPALVPPSSKNGAGGAGGFADSIARDLHAEISTKVLSIVPQPGDWDCPVCLDMAWRPVNLGCCRALFCIRCVIKMQDDGIKRCPACNAETVSKADGRNIDFDAMDFLQKYFPLEAKRRQKENEKANLERQYGEEFTRPGCSVQ